MNFAEDGVQLRLVVLLRQLSANIPEVAESVWIGDG